MANITENEPKPKAEVEEPAKDEGKVSEIVYNTYYFERLGEYVGEASRDEIIAFHKKMLAKPDAKAATFGSIYTPPVEAKATRGLIHGLIRGMFSAQIETQSDEENRIRLFAAPRGTARSNNPRSDRGQQKQSGQLNGKLGWDELGGPHLHFSLYKENKDTMEVISFLSKGLRTKPSDFSFAGTKDRRAVTVQRVSVFKQHAEKLETLNHQLRNARVGNFTYEKQRLELGELAGNLFTITLRDCHFPNDLTLDVPSKVKLATKCVNQAVHSLQKDGFINYFGMQRFGTFEIGTNEVGKLILQGDFKGAVDAILTYSEDTLAKAKDKQPEDKIGRDDLARAQAINLFRTSGKSHDAIDMLPRRFNAEGAIMRHLGGRNGSSDYIGALNMIPRALRTMYVHAYQSYIWNMVASERWARYGPKVVKGDLILIDRHAQKPAALDEVDENGEVVIHPAGNEIAVNHNDLYDRARPLTEEEASSGDFNIHDIVLPLPGFDIEYPNNDIGDYYKEFMASERGGGLDPADMRRTTKDFSLSGSYRKFMATIGRDFSFEIKTYHDEVQQLVETDLERLFKSRPEKENKSGNDNLQSEADKNGASQNARGRGGKNNSGSGNGSGQSRWSNDQQNSRGGRGRENNGRGGFSNGNRAFNANEAAAANRAKWAGTAQGNAWKNAPGMLAAQDKAAAAAADLAKATKEPVTTAPVIHETWIQTSAENFKVLTGQTATTVISEGRGVTPAESQGASNLAASIDGTSASKSGVVQQVEVDAMDIDKKQPKPIASTADTSDVVSVASTSDESSGGAALSRKPSSAVAEVPVLSPVSDGAKPAEQPSSRKPSVSSTTSENPTPSTTSEGVQLVEKVAVIIKFSLKSSQYATVALRELMQGVKNYKPDYNNGR